MVRVRTFYVLSRDLHYDDNGPRQQRPTTTKDDRQPTLLTHYTGRNDTVILTSPYLQPNLLFVHCQNQNKVETRHLLYYSAKTNKTAVIPYCCTTAFDYATYYRQLFPKPTTRFPIIYSIVPKPKERAEIRWVETGNYFPQTCNLFSTFFLETYNLPTTQEETRLLTSVTYYLLQHYGAYYL